MNLKSDISFYEAYSFSSENERKKYDKLIKAVSSTNKDNFNFFLKKSVSEWNFDFSHKEIHSAVKRLDINKFNLLFSDKELDKYFQYDESSFWDYIDNTNTLEGLINSVDELTCQEGEFDDEFEKWTSEKYVSLVLKSDPLKERVLTELYFKKIARALSNTLSKFFSFRKIIAAQSPIKIVAYKYFDLIFSLKKEVVLKSYSVINLFNNLFYLRSSEKTKYFRSIPAFSGT
ncbi:MAG: hypothetical protein IH595_02330 [Bacteroidales bacterium]|nr:hypothetical protein [Bacteroidales bacterium]